VTGQVVGVDSERIEIGMPVEADVGRTETDGSRIVVFEPR
jgi:uncharacterized OB-fold protein